MNWSTVIWALVGCLLAAYGYAACRRIERRAEQRGAQRMAVVAAQETARLRGELQAARRERDRAVSDYMAAEIRAHQADRAGFERGMQARQMFGQAIDDGAQDI